MSTPKISIIVPVYKAENYLHKCVDSILAQTFTDFELLLIDDGSLDKSGVICDEYAKKDNRVRVFHKENGGVSSARNLGLDNARGEWITFIDSDDWVEKEYLQNMIYNANSDMIVNGFKSFGGRDREKSYDKTELIHISGNLERLWDIKENYAIWLVPWIKFFKNEKLNEFSIRFNEKLFYGEDFCFVIDYMTHIKDVTVVSKKDYNFFITTDVRFLKYSMKLEQFENHLYIHEDKFMNIENVHNQSRCLAEVRREIITRLFYCLLYQMISLPFSQFAKIANEINKREWKKRVIKMSFSSRNSILVSLLFNVPILLYFILKQKLQK